jgi:predicted RNase H-like HicB family nuclease
MKSEYPYVINYQYFTKFIGVPTCHFDFVQGKTLESAREVLSERRRLHDGLQVLFETKKIEEN